MPHTVQWFGLNGTRGIAGPERDYWRQMFNVEQGAALRRLPVADLAALELPPGAVVIGIEGDGTERLYQANGSGVPAVIPPGDFLQAGAGAVTRTVTSKLRDWLDAADFGVLPTNPDNVAAFQSLLARVSARGGARIRISLAGTYAFDVDGDADTLQVPSNCEIDCDPGVIFRWDYWGSPLFAIVNVSRVRISGAHFVWAGTFDTTSGNRDGFGYGAAIPAYEWCSHIIAAGSDDVTLEHLSCAGATTANRQNNFLEVIGHADAGAPNALPATGIRIHDIHANDIGGQVIGLGVTAGTQVRGVVADRYGSDSNGLYGPGHVVYQYEISPAYTTDLLVDGVIDLGTALGSFVSGAQTLSIKRVKGARIANIASARREGILNFHDSLDSDYEGLTFRSADTTADNGPIYAVDPSAAGSHRNTFRNLSVRWLGGSDHFGVNFGDVTDETRFTGNVVDGLYIRRDAAAPDARPFVRLRGIGNAIRNYVAENRGSSAKAIIQFTTNAADNDVEFSVIGTIRGARIDWSSAGSGNSVRVNPPSDPFYPQSTLPPANTMVDFDLPDVITFAANDATPSVIGGRTFKTANAMATTITALDDGYSGKVVRVIINDANTTIDFTGTTLKGNSGVDWTPASGDSMTCVYDGTNWYCDISDNTA